MCGVLGVGPGGRVTISQVKMAEGHSRRESTVIILGTNKVILEPTLQFPELRIRTCTAVAEIRHLCTRIHC